MPKIVDHEKRRVLISEATWRVIQKEGMEGATVRNIAKEAGLSLGALRHYFSTHEELLLYSMNLVKENAAKRMEKIAMGDLHPVEKVLRLLLEMIPTSSETRIEMEVWFAFMFHSLHKKETYVKYDDGIFTAILKMFDLLEHFGLLQEGIKKEEEAEILHALVDGLAIHGLVEPESLPRLKAEKLLNLHLQK